MPTDDLRTKMEAQIKAAEEDIQRLRAAIEVLDGNGSEPARRPEPRRTPRRRAAKPAQPTVVPVGKLLDLVKGSEGLTTRELAKQTGGESSAILELLKEQETEGNVRRTGNRASTRWHTETSQS